MSKNFAKTLVWKHEYDVILWRHTQRTPNADDHHMPLNENTPHEKFRLTPLQWYTVIWKSIKFLAQQRRESIIDAENGVIWYLHWTLYMLHARVGYFLKKKIVRFKKILIWWNKAWIFASVTQDMKNTYSNKNKINYVKASTTPGLPLSREKSKSKI